MLLTIPQAAEALGVCDFSIRRMIWRGELRHVRIGRALRIRRDDLQSWIEENTVRNGTATEAKQRQGKTQVSAIQ